MPKDKSYGICPYLKEGNTIKILLNKTSKVSDYNFFKGKIEDKESVKKCALREFYEETNIPIDKKDLGLYFFQSNKRKDIGIFLVNFEDYKNIHILIDKKEIHSYEWLDINDNISFSRNQRDIFRDIVNHFRISNG